MVILCVSLSVFLEGQYLLLDSGSIFRSGRETYVHCVVYPGSEARSWLSALSTPRAVIFRP